MVASTTKTKGPLSDKVTTPDDIGYLNLLLFGAPGAGKTMFVGTAQDHPMTAPLLLLDVEGGTTTLRGRKDIDVIQVRSPADVIEAHNALRTENNGFYRTVAIDSLSELQDVDMNEIMRQLIRDKGTAADPDVPGLRQWGQTRIHMRRIVRAFRDLPVNTIFTALVNEDKDTTTGITTIQPAFPGRLKIEVPGFLDVVGYLYTTNDGEGVIRRVQFAQTRRIIAKDRTNAFGDFVDNPTIPMLWDMLHTTNDTEKGTE